MLEQLCSNVHKIMLRRCLVIFRFRAVSNNKQNSLCESIKTFDLIFNFGITQCSVYELFRCSGHALSQSKECEMLPPNPLWPMATSTSVQVGRRFSRSRFSVHKITRIYINQNNYIDFTIVTVGKQQYLVGGFFLLCLQLTEFLHLAKSGRLLCSILCRSEVRAARSDRHKVIGVIIVDLCFVSLVCCLLCCRQRNQMAFVAEEAAEYGTTHFYLTQQSTPDEPSEEFLLEEHQSKCSDCSS